MAALPALLPAFSAVAGSEQCRQHKGIQYATPLQIVHNEPQKRCRLVASSPSSQLERSKLRKGDFVVHVHYGIGKFEGVFLSSETRVGRDRSGLGSCFSSFSIPEFQWLS